MNPVYEKLLKCYDSFKEKIDFEKGEIYAEKI